MARRRSNSQCMQSLKLTIRTHNDRLACDAHIKIESLLAFMGYFCRHSAWALRRVRGTSTPTFSFGWIYKMLLRICASTWTELNSGVFEAMTPVHIDRGSKWCILILCALFEHLNLSFICGKSWQHVRSFSQGLTRFRELWLMSYDSGQKMVGFNQGSTRVLEKVDLDQHLSLLLSFVL